MVLGDLRAILGGLGAVLGGLGASWGGLGGSWGDLVAILGRSWAVLGRSWGVLGRSWGVLGRLGVVLGRSWGALGGSWGAPGAPWGDPKSTKKSIRNLMRKQAESRRKKMAQTLRLSMFQDFINLSGTRMTSPKKVIKTAIDMISSYLSIDSLPRRPNHNLRDASFQVSKPLRPPFDTFFDANLAPGLVLGSSWAILGRSWGTPGPPWAILGAS